MYDCNTMPENARDDNRGKEETIIVCARADAPIVVKGSVMTHRCFSAAHCPVCQPKRPCALCGGKGGNTGPGSCLACEGTGLRPAMPEVRG